MLWSVRRVDVDMNGTDVAGVVLKNLEAVWGVGSMLGCWVENKQSTYVVVRSILEREWLSDVGGTQGLAEGNLGIMWGPRQPVVVSRAWNRVDVMVELIMAEASKGAVIRRLVYCGIRRTVHMAAGGGGASVARLVHGTGGRRVDPRSSAGFPVGMPTRMVERGCDSCRWGRASGVRSQVIGRISVLTREELLHEAPLHAGGRVISAGIAHAGPSWTGRLPGALRIRES